MTYYFYDALLTANELKKYKIIIDNIIRLKLEPKFTDAISMAVHTIEKQLDWVDSEETDTSNKQKTCRSFVHTNSYIRTVFYICIHNKMNCNPILVKDLLIILFPYIKDKGYRLKQLRRVCLLFALSIIKDVTSFNLNPRNINYDPCEQMFIKVMDMLSFIIQFLSKTLSTDLIDEEPYFIWEDDNFNEATDSIYNLNEIFIGHVNWRKYHYDYDSSFHEQFHTPLTVDYEFNPFCSFTSSLDLLDIQEHKKIIDIISLNSLDINIKNIIDNLISEYNDNEKLKKNRNSGFDLSDKLINVLIFLFNVLDEKEEGLVTFEQIYIILHSSDHFMNQRIWEIRRVFFLISIIYIEYQFYSPMNQLKIQDGDFSNYQLLNRLINSIPKHIEYLFQTFLSQKITSIGALEFRHDNYNITDKLKTFPKNSYYNDLKYKHLKGLGKKDSKRLELFCNNMAMLEPQRRIMGKLFIANDLKCSKKMLYEWYSSIPNKGELAIYTQSTFDTFYKRVIKKHTVFRCTEFPSKIETDFFQ